MLLLFYIYLVPILKVGLIIAESVWDVLLSYLEVEYLDGEGKHETKENSEANNGSSCVTQVIMRKPKESIDEIFHYFPIFQLNICNVSKLGSHKSI